MDKLEKPSPKKVLFFLSTSLVSYRTLILTLTLNQHEFGLTEVRDSPDASS